MFRTTVIFKRFLHDRKLPSIEGYTIKDPIVKSSFTSPRKWNINKRDKIIERKKKNSWIDYKKYKWFSYYI